MKIDKKEAGKRFKEFLEERFGTIADGARYLKKNPSGLRSNYFNGKSLPGPDILLSLMDAGCDIVWLLTGEHATKRLSERIIELEQQRDYYKHQYEKCIKDFHEIKISFDRQNQLIKKLTEGAK